MLTKNEGTRKEGRTRVEVERNEGERERPEKRRRRGESRLRECSVGAAVPVPSVCGLTIKLLARLSSELSFGRRPRYSSYIIDRKLN